MSNKPNSELSTITTKLNLFRAFKNKEGHLVCRVCKEKLTSTSGGETFSACRNGCFSTHDLFEISQQEYEIVKNDLGQIISESPTGKNNVFYEMDDKANKVASFFKDKLFTVSLDGKVDA